MSVFTEAAKRAGFTAEQAKFMEEFVALSGHHHDIEEVDGLEEALGEVEEEEDEDED